MASSKQDRRKDRVVCVNRRARYEYQVLDTLEAGLVLTGAEVKALREGKGQLADAYALLSEGRAVLKNLEIAPYSHDHTGESDSKRSRSLLLHAAEIRKILFRLREKGLAIVPLSIYFKGPWAKVELGLVRGRRKADKRQALREKAHKREMDRVQRRR